MKAVTNTRTTDGPVTTWLMGRVVAGCRYGFVVKYNRYENRREVAHRIWCARRQLHIACEQQRDAIRLARL